MTYKSKQTWRDLVDKPHHHGITRRDLITRGLVTASMSISLPWGLLSTIANKAYAAPLNCPPVTKAPGAIAQIFAEGGPTMGARFIGEDQAAMMNAAIAANYGITGTNLLRLGPNLVIDTTSPFGKTILQGPTGFPGGSAGWQTSVLSKISGGGHRGPFSADDGAGQNTGLIGGVSPFKVTQMGKDLRINVQNRMANWAGGLPFTSIGRGNLTSTNLARLFSVTPAAAGLTTSQAMTDASNAAVAIADALAGTFNLSNRNGSTELSSSAGCAIQSNATLADPAYGPSLFNVAGIPELSANLNIAALSGAEQALLGSYFQSAKGVIGGVSYQLGGRDYHGANVTTVIAPADIEEARAIVMFLAACHAAGERGAFIYFSNGQAIAEGVQNVTATIGDVTTTVNAPVAKGDAGGAYNAGLIIFYDPAGSQPSPRMTGIISSNNGNARMDAALTSSADAVSGLYLSALKFVNGGTIPAAALTAMKVTNPSGIVVI